MKEALKLSYTQNMQLIFACMCDRLNTFSCMHTHEYPILTLAPLFFTHAADVFQESAYVDALSIAAIAHAVAKVT